MASIRTNGISEIHRDYKKDKKVGEGAYAVVYQGSLTTSLFMNTDTASGSLLKGLISLVNTDLSGV